jgi:small GTP-binding protein
MTISRRNIFKVIVIGEGGVGKTCLVRKYVDDVFAQDMKMTIGVDLSVKRISDGGGEKILQIWDLGGQPHFKEVADIYFRGAKGILAVYDVTRRASMDRLVDWIERVQTILGRIPMVVVANKIDLRNPGEGINGVENEEGAEFASKYGAPYVEASAKDNLGVDEAFRTLAAKLEMKTDTK